MSAKKKITVHDLQPGASFRLFRERWHVVGSIYDGEDWLIVCKTWLRHKGRWAYETKKAMIWDIDLEYIDDFRRT